MYDPIQTSALNKMLQKYDCGVKEHGGGLHEKTDDPVVWLTNLQEEMIDAVFYIEKLLYDLKS